MAWLILIEEIKAVASELGPEIVDVVQLAP